MPTLATHGKGGGRSRRSNKSGLVRLLKFLGLGSVCAEGGIATDGSVWSHGTWRSHPKRVRRDSFGLEYGREMPLLRDANFPRAEERSKGSQPGSDTNKAQPHPNVPGTYVENDDKDRKTCSDPAPLYFARPGAEFLSFGDSCNTV